MDWMPITIVGDPELAGLHEGRSVYRITLSRGPDADWSTYLNQGRRPSLDPFEIRNNQVIVRPPPSRLEQYLQDVRRHVDAANERYRQTVLSEHRLRHHREDDDDVTARTMPAIVPHLESIRNPGNCGLCRSRSSICPRSVGAFAATGVGGSRGRPSEAAGSR